MSYRLAPEHALDGLDAFVEPLVVLALHEDVEAVVVERAALDELVAALAADADRAAGFDLELLLRAAARADDQGEVVVVGVVVGDVNLLALLGGLVVLRRLELVRLHQLQLLDDVVLLPRDELLEALRARVHSLAGLVVVDGRRRG